MGKGLLGAGLAMIEARFSHGWHRHMTLACRARLPRQAVDQLAQRLKVLLGPSVIAHSIFA